MDPWPADTAASAMLLRALVESIDSCSFELGDVLLAVFLHAAWPTDTAQWQ